MPLEKEEIDKYITGYELSSLGEQMVNELLIEIHKILSLLMINTNFTHIHQTAEQIPIVPSLQHLQLRQIDTTTKSPNFLSVLKDNQQVYFYKLQTLQKINEKIANLMELKKQTITIENDNSQFDSFKQDLIEKRARLKTQCVIKNEVLKEMIDKIRNLQFFINSSSSLPSFVSNTSDLQ